MYAIRSYYAGSGVVSTRSNMHWVVTEFGAVNLYGKTLQERAKLLISIAHPDHKDSLDHVITSYSIHYTKLYELGFSSPVSNDCW